MSGPFGIIGSISTPTILILSVLGDTYSSLLPSWEPKQ